MVKRIILLTCVLLFVLVAVQQQQPIPVPNEPTVNVVVHESAPTVKFTDWPTSTTFTNSLQDIEAHPTRSHQTFGDKVTQGHESTHDINSLISETYGQPGFYVLNNKAILIPPLKPIALSQIVVPSSLHGFAYHYFSFYNKPFGIFDEWAAYCNGSQVALDLNLDAHGENKFVSELAVYCFCILKQIQPTDMQTCLFVKYQLDRTLRLRHEPDSFNILRDSPDADGLRIFIRSYLGKDYTQQHLGF